jgi:hypothetical protein
MNPFEALDQLETGWKAATPIDWGGWATSAEAFCAQLSSLNALDELLLIQLRRRVSALQARVAMTWQYHREVNAPESSDYSASGAVQAGRLRPRLVIQG